MSNARLPSLTSAPLGGGTGGDARAGNSDRRGNSNGTSNSGYGGKSDREGNRGPERNGDRDGGGHGSVDGAAGWPALREQASVTCRARGVHWTALREAVLHALWSAKAPVGAYELAAGLRGRAGGNLSANSVYRVLTLLQELGLVHRIESKHAYIAARPEEAAADLFLLCESCGAVATGRSAELSENLAARSQALGFQPTRQIVELRGRCHDCDTAHHQHG
jgi:Fur family transcriptional regulator, zinc uptake regulator